VHLVRRVDVIPLQESCCLFLRGDFLAWIGELAGRGGGMFEVFWQKILLLGEIELRDDSSAPVVLVARLATQTAEKIVNVRRIDSGNRSRKGFDQTAHVSLDVAHVVISSTAFLQVLEIFLVNFVSRGSVSDSLAKGVMEIDRCFESGALHAVSQVGVKTAGLINFEIERLDCFLSENVDAAILLGEVLGADAVAGQLASQFFGKHFGFRECVAAPEDAPCPLIINHLERRVSLAIRAAVIRLEIHPRLTCEDFFSSLTVTGDALIGIVTEPELISAIGFLPLLW
jgi:hypothetical protein